MVADILVVGPDQVWVDRGIGLRRSDVRFTDDAATLGRCVTCGGPTSRLANCADSACTTLEVRCPGCVGAHPEHRCPVCADRAATHALERTPA